MFSIDGLRYTTCITGVDKGNMEELSSLVKLSLGLARVDEVHDF